jgi:hypothetical protein
MDSPNLPRADLTPTDLLWTTLESSAIDVLWVVEFLVDISKECEICVDFEGKKELAVKSHSIFF